MDIGSAIAVFLVLSILMLALFCFVTKYFHYKLKRAIQETNEVYSMVDQIYHNTEDDINNDDQDEKYKVITPKQRKQLIKNQNQDIYIQMADIRTPLKQQAQSIYKKGILKQKLNASGLQAISKQQSSRDISELKSFRPQKLITTNRTNRSSQQKLNTLPSKHTFIHKLICYNEGGITVIDIIVKMIRKISEGVIKDSKTCKVHNYSTSQDNFDDQLEIMGFERNVYGCYKYQTTVQVSNMKTDQNYLVKSLKTSQAKQQISQEEYIKYRIQLPLGRNFE